MSTTLGLDLGSNSIGWALIDEEEESIVAAGVRVFPEGVDRDQKGGEKSKSQTRRVARGMRRQLARRARRRRELRALLTANALLPSDSGDLDNVLSLDPYALRSRALDDQLEPFEIGRILLHLNQHRGFLSNRKADRGQDKERKGMLAQIGELATNIETSESRTLGEYLAKINETLEHTASGEHDRIRNRHTRRDMYQMEFEAIWSAQHKYYPALLTDELKLSLNNPHGDDKWIHKGLIFGQRRMYWPKSVIGRCELEGKEKRSHRADRAAQQFRMLQEVNNLRLLDGVTGDERQLSNEERTTLLSYLSEAKQRTFDQIRKKLGFHNAVHFNLEGPERNKLKGNETDAALKAKKILGKRWEGFTPQVKDDIVTVLIEEEHEDEGLRRLVEDCGLDHDEAERALTVNLPDGRMNFSRKAILNLLPHLERGLALMGDDESNSALHAAGYLRPDQREVGQREFLPVPPDLPNPIVRQAIVEVRKVVNAVLREYGKPARIHVELAREAKQSFDQRKETRFENAKRGKLRDDARSRIDEYRSDIKPTRRTVDRYLLWQEQEEYCVYCARKISLAQLFDGDTDIDHILPRWRSLDDSLANKVICHRVCNSEKGDRTPREWLEDSDPERYAKVLSVAEKLPYNKQRRFQQKDIRLDDFVDRQLRDTAYISRSVSQYLRCLGVGVVCTRGQMTANLRHWWGLDTILDTEGRGEKNRADHRHHAIDAITIALTDRKRLHSLANARGRDMPLPWPYFPDHAEAIIEGIRVSHRVQRRLHGAFHEATIYGRTQRRSGADTPIPTEQRPWAKGWIEDQNTYARRKPIHEFKKVKELEKVRDPAIKELLKRHLVDRGIDCDKGAEIPKDAFNGSNTPRMLSGVPIRRVRMLEHSETFRQISSRRSNQYVKPGNNHHIVYRAVVDGEKQKWTAEVVTMWDAATRTRTSGPLVDRSDEDNGHFVMSLSIGEMFEMDANGNSPRRILCVVQKLRQDDKRLYYKRHTDARPSEEWKKDNLSVSPTKMQQRNARKVTVDPIGCMRWAGD